MVSEPNSEVCEVKKAHTIEVDSFGAQQRRFDQLVGVNYNTQVLGIWWCMTKGVKELSWVIMSPKYTYLLVKTGKKILTFFKSM